MNNEEISCNVSIILYPSYKMMNRGRGGEGRGTGDGGRIWREREQKIINRKKHGNRS